MLKMSPWGAGYKDFCVFVFSPFRKFFRCFIFLSGYWIFWWPRLDSLKDGIMFAESGVANERVTTPFKKKTFFFLPFLPRWVNEEYRANARSPGNLSEMESGIFRGKIRNLSGQRSQNRKICINILIYSSYL